MLLKENISLDGLENGTFSQPWLIENSTYTPNLHRHVGSGSGGYADNIFIYAAKEIFGVEVKNVQYKALRYFIHIKFYYYSYLNKGLNSFKIISSSAADFSSHHCYMYF